MARRYTYDKSKARPVKNLEGKTVAPPDVLDKNYLLANKIPIWVYWNMNLKHARYTFSIGEGNRGFEIKDADSSQLPYCVTNTVPFKHFVNGMTDFWDTIENQNFILVWPSDVPEAAKKTSSKKASRFAMTDDGEASEEAQRLSKLQDEVALDRERLSVLAEGNTDSDVVLDDQINDRLMSIVASLTAEDIKHDEAIKQIMHIEDDLTKKDLSWAVAKTSGKTCTYLKGSLAKISADSNSLFDVSMTSG